MPRLRRFSLCYNKAKTEALRWDRDRSNASRKGCMKIAPCFSAGIAESPQNSQVPAGTNEEETGKGVPADAERPVSVTMLERCHES